MDKRTAWLQFFAVVLLLVAPALIATRVYAEPPEIRVISGPVVEWEGDAEEIDWGYYEREQVLNLIRQRQPKLPEITRMYYRDLVWEKAEKYQLRPTYVAKMVDEESRFNAKAISKIWDKRRQEWIVCAKGIAQIYAKYHKLNDYFDPDENLDYGCKYLRAQLDRFQDEALALAAYNAGPGAVQRYQGVPPYEETRGYVKRVLTGEKKLKGSGYHG